MYWYVWNMHMVIRNVMFFIILLNIELVMKYYNNYNWYSSYQLITIYIQQFYDLLQINNVYHFISYIYVYSIYYYLFSIVISVLLDDIFKPVLWRIFL